MLQTHCCSIARSTRLTRWAALLVVGLFAASAGCADKGQTIPSSQPLSAQLQFEGVWYSPQFEHMFLRRQGDKVVGVYAYENGGRLEGTVDGNLLKFEWEDPGSKQHAQRGMSGHGYLQLVRKDGEPRLVGEWGYNADRTGGGPWNAEWIRKIESKDPETLEDIQNWSGAEF